MASQAMQAHRNVAPAHSPHQVLASPPPQGPASADGLPCNGAIPHSAAPALCQVQRGSLGVTAWPPPTRSTLTLVEEDIARIKGDTSKDVVGSAGVALVHPLDLHVQPAVRAEPC